jgi:hypothetical protein
MLQKYGIVTLKGGSADVGRLLVKQYGFKENIDFNLSQLAEVRARRGTVLKNEYYLHPRIFKICLMRSTNTRQYAYYYILLEECIKHYNDYQNLLKEKYIINLKSKIQQKDDKIDELKEMLRQSDLRAEQRINEMKEQSTKNMKKIQKENKKIINKLDDTNIKLDVTNEELTETKTEMKYISKKLNIAVEDRIQKIDDSNKLECLILLKNRRKNADFKYLVIRGQKKYAEPLSNKKVTEEKYKEIFQINEVANSVALWNIVKKKIKKQIEYIGNELNLVTINQEELINTINETYEEKKIINVKPVVETSDSDSD